MRVSSSAAALLSDSKFDIEFYGYLSNHAKHAIIALQGLQASDERTKEYWDFYTNETPYGLQLEPATAWDEVDTTMTRRDWDAWRGKKVNWQEQVSFFLRQLESSYDGDTDKLVSDFAPDLLDGFPGALTHGTIHLGWSIDAQSAYMIAEGLAYMNFAYIGIEPAKLQDDVHDDGSPIDSFMRIAQTFEKEDLQTLWVDRVKEKYDESFHSELVAAGFQWHVAKLLFEPHAVATELPVWLTNNANTDEIWEQLYRSITTVYLATRDPTNGSGDFVVLHLLTSLWALEQICRVFERTLSPKEAEELTRRAWKQHFASVVVLLSTAGFLASAALEKARDEFGAENNTPADLDWGPVVRSGIAEEEEHNIKLVYVMRELWKRYGHWKGFFDAANAFTPTPNVKGGMEEKAKES